MSIVTVNLPPGMYKNATPYGKKSRWTSGNLVRWYNGSLRPIGGWVRLTVDDNDTLMDPVVADPSVETVRDGFAWRTNSGDRLVAWGSNSSLYRQNTSNLIADITPAGFVGTGKDATVLTGYGLGSYGRQTFGTPRYLPDSSPEFIWRWKLDAWGQDLIAGPNGLAGGIYAWTPGDAQAVLIPNAPTDVTNVAVTNERFVMAVGSATEPRRVHWSDRENRTQWTAAVDNLAGGITLPGEGKLLSINSVLNGVFILSETDAYVGRYIGAPLVYGFDKVGARCGPLHPASLLVTDSFAMWLGRQNFWIYDGQVRQVPCDVMDFLVEDMDTTQISKIYAVHVADFSEIWWYYQSVEDLEVGSYVVYDYAANHWAVGKLKRTAAVVGDTVEPLYKMDDSSLVYKHEVNGVIPEGGAYAETGPLEIGDGEVNMAVRYLYPDTTTFGDVQYTFYASEMPTATEHTFGPYTYDNPISTRVMGRQIRMRVDGLLNSWQVGSKTRFDIAPTNTGRR